METGTCKMWVVKSPTVRVHVCFPECIWLCIWYFDTVVNEYGISAEINTSVPGAVASPGGMPMWDLSGIWPGSQASRPRGPG